MIKMWIYQEDGTLELQILKETKDITDKQTNEVNYHVDNIFMRDNSTFI